MHLVLRTGRNSVDLEPGAKRRHLEKKTPLWSHTASRAKHLEAPYPDLAFRFSKNSFCHLGGPIGHFRAKDIVKVHPGT